MYFIGIDSGKNGAIALFDSKYFECVIGFGDDTLLAIRSLIQTYESAFRNEGVFAMIEKAQAMPGQGVKSMFSYGKQYGVIIGVLRCYDIPFEEIHPVRWKRAFGLIGKDKAASVAEAERRFQKEMIPFTTKRGRLLDGRAEAMLIAEYARLTKEAW